MIQMLIHLGPMLTELFPDDVTVGISDTTTLRISIPGKKFSLGLEPGYRLTPGDGMFEAVQTGRPVRMAVPKDVFGVPLISSAIPLRDEQGTVIGAMAVGVNMERYEHLFSIASTLSTAVEQISATIQELASSTNVLSINMNDISAQSNEVRKSINNINHIANTVRDISNKSKILGLNASIEAARSSEFGKGFSIIAQEVRKLAADSKEQTDIIHETVHNIEQLIHSLTESVSAINQETDSQSVAAEQLASTIQELSQSANALAEYAQNIVSGTHQDN